jgi:hypothetical protein
MFRTTEKSLRKLNCKLALLLNENPTRTLKDLSKALNVKKTNDELMQKKPSETNNQCKMILLYARPHVARTVKEALLEFEWEVLPT